MLARHWAVFWVCMGAVFLVTMDATLQPLALGGIEEGFGTSRTATAWVLSAYSISLATFVVAAGRLADRSGRKQAFLVGLALFVLGAVGGWLAPELWVLVLCRAVQGAGSAFVMPASIGLILAVWPEDDQTRAITNWTAVGGIAGALAPLVGGGLIDIWGWRAAYVLSVIIGAPSFLAARTLLTDTERKVTSRFPDLVGAFMVAGSLGLLTLSLVQGRTWGWSDPRIVVAFALAVVLIPLIRQRILGHPAPIVEPRLLKLRTYRRALFIATAIPGFLFPYFVMMIQYLEQVWDYRPLKAGLALLPFPAAATLASVAAGHLSRRFDERTITIAAMSMTTIAVVWLRLVPGTDPAYWQEYFLPIILGGIGGWGMGLPMINAIGARDLDNDTYSLGMGVLSTARQVGALTGLAIVFGLLGNVSDTELANRFNQVWTVLIVLSALGVAVSLTLPRRSLTASSP
ncbi:MFS transporter [Candidatus Poriferisocius sp.]|uniref:MFS transporter n=1 Tax=Candidatus Poriferisocius sp. TaxID=3101276 RepID=UPI003B01AD22